MHRAQLLAFGLDERLAELLRELAEARALWLREVRHVKACLNLLRPGGAAVLVLCLGKDLDQELFLLDQVTTFFPWARTIALCPTNNPPLAALAWDLGAAYVLSPPQPLERICDLVAGFVPSPQLPGSKS